MLLLYKQLIWLLMLRYLFILLKLEWLFKKLYKIGLYKCKENHPTFLLCGPHRWNCERTCSHLAEPTVTWAWMNLQDTLATYWFDCLRHSELVHVNVTCSFIHVLVSYLLCCLVLAPGQMKLWNFEEHFFQKIQTTFLNFINK